MSESTSTEVSEDLPSTEAPEEAVDDASKGAVVLCNKAGTLGVRFYNDYSVQVIDRILYTEVTEIKAGVNTKTFQPGDYGGWRATARPHHTSFKVSMPWVRELLLKDTLTQAGEVVFLDEVLEFIEAICADLESRLKPQLDALLEKQQAKRSKKRLE